MANTKHSIYLLIFHWKTNSNWTKTKLHSNTAKTKSKPTQLLINYITFYRPSHSMMMEVWGVNW